jgi:eukaryotic-like serine/threonine-protein kinase
VIPSAISHYRIVSKIGSGGMGEVYLAEDQRLGRPVALKLLPARFTANVERVRRFEQEARAVGALNHPNILTIYEIGHADTPDGHVQFMAIEFVEGQTLQQRLFERPMTIEEAVDVAIQICSALAAAHGAGITHRDIKPENVMLRQDGLVKVLDFGLAKLTERPLLATDDLVTHAEALDSAIPPTDPAPSGWRPTVPGAILGTVRYMSPEQARGFVADPRSDLFSLGVVLYEMITGRTPFERGTSTDTLVAILEHESPPLSRYVPAAPAELGALVAKLLAKDRSARYQSSRNLVGELKAVQQRLWVARETESVVQAAEAVERVQSPEKLDVRESSQTSSPARRALDSLAVLPFVTLSQDPNAVYLAEGIPESLIRNLSRLSQLRVMAWSTVARFRGLEPDPVETGRALGVRAIFTARMHQIADVLIIRAELVDVLDGSQIWGEQFRRKLDDLFAIDQEISQEICDHLRLKLNEDDRERLSRRYTQNAAAYQSYLKGRYYWNQRSARSLRKAVESFEEAIRHDSQYALAYAGLADSYCLMCIYGTASPKIFMPRARAAATTALQIDESLAEAHTSMALALAWFDWDWAGSDREFARAIELSPAYAVAHHFHGSVLLTIQRRFDEALAAERRALDLEPLSLIINSSIGFIYYQAHRFEEAIDALLRTLEMDESFTYARYNLAMSYAQLGRYDQAIAEFRRALELAGGRGALFYAALGYAYGLVGRQSDANQMLESLRTSGRETSPFYEAMVHVGAGQHDEAIACLTTAVDDRFNWVVWLHTEPMFSTLHRDPRFVALTRRMSLPDPGGPFRPQSAPSQRNDAR